MRKSIQSLGGSTVFGRQRGWEEAKKAPDEAPRMLNMVYMAQSKFVMKVQGVTLAFYSDESPGLMVSYQTLNRRIYTKNTFQGGCLPFPP